MSRSLDSQPESLLEGDGGPVGRKADLILARLIGFVLQNGYATYRLAPEYAPPGVTAQPPDLMVSVLFVRYRRRG